MTNKKKNTPNDPESKQEKNLGNDKKWSVSKKSARIRSEALQKIIDYYKDKKQRD